MLFKWMNCSGSARKCEVFSTQKCILVRHNLNQWQFFWWNLQGKGTPFFITKKVCIKWPLDITDTSFNNIQAKLIKFSFLLKLTVTARWWSFCMIIFSEQLLQKRLHTIDWYLNRKYVSIILTLASSFVVRVWTKCLF